MTDTTTSTATPIRIAGQPEILQVQHESGQVTVRLTLEPEPSRTWKNVFEQSEPDVRVGRSSLTTVLQTDEMAERLDEIEASITSANHVTAADRNIDTWWTERKATTSGRDQPHPDVSVDPPTPNHNVAVQRPMPKRNVVVEPRRRESGKRINGALMVGVSIVIAITALAFLGGIG